MKLFLADRAKKDFLKLPKQIKSKVSQKIDLLENKPFVGKKLSGELGDHRSLRSWPYRIIYHINPAKKEIWVDHIIHRQGAYK